MAEMHQHRIFDMAAYTDWRVTPFSEILSVHLSPCGVNIVHGSALGARPAPDEGARGQYLCELCFDVMTDQVLPAEQSETGMEMACCAACWSQGRGGGRT